MDQEKLQYGAFAIPLRSDEYFYLEERAFQELFIRDLERRAFTVVLDNGYGRLKVNAQAEADGKVLTLSFPALTVTVFLPDGEGAAAACFRLSAPGSEPCYGRILMENGMTVPEGLQLPKLHGLLESITV